MSGLSVATLVVEAPEKSGALITARYALMQGRALFAVPGDITAERSMGTNRLLQAGARPALSAEDVLSPLRARYHTALSDQALLEAAQYSALTAEALAPFGMRCDLSPDAEKQEKPQRTKQKKSKRREQKQEAAPQIPAQRESQATDTSMLSARQQQLYALLPDTPFTVDLLTEQGVPVSEAVGTLTVLEIYGLLASRPGGVYVKK